MISMEQKRRIVARNFYTENADQYKNYEEARKEMSNPDNVNDRFIDFAVEPYIKPIEGHVLITNELGHVLSIRESDGFVTPLTAITEEEIEQMVVAYKAAGVKHGYDNKLSLVEKIGWSVIKESK